MKRKKKRLSPTPSSQFDPTKFGMLPQQSAVTPTNAQTYRNGRTLPSNMYEPAPEDPEDPESEPPEDDRIIEQARALKNSVDLIYEFVHDQIEFLPTYGLHKGGLGAMIDGSGNSFDQSDLMVRLLRESGYTANFVIGLIDLEDEQWSNWLGIDLQEQTAITIASQLLANGGIGHTIDTQTGKIKLEHCWVQATIGQTQYVFDPSFKQYASTAGITNLEDAILGENNDISDFLDDAKSGATYNTDYAQNIHDANITSNLTAYCNNLIDHIQDNMPGASMNEVLGGRSIVSIVGEDAVRDTELAYEDQGTTPSVVDAIPDKSKAVMLVQYDWTGTHYRIDMGFFSSDIYSKRMTLWFDEDRMASLYLDGEVVDGPSGQMTAGDYEDLIITIGHPYADDFADAVQHVPIRTGGQTIIGNAWGVSSKDMAAVHQLVQNEAVAAGTAADAENMLGISLLLVFDNFIGQASLGLDMLSRMAHCNSAMHHFVGVISHQTYGTARRNSINTFLGGWNVSPLDDTTDTRSVGVTSSMFFQILESAAHQQVSGVEAADIIKAVKVANLKVIDEQTGDRVPIYNADASNWDTGTDVRGIMETAGYDSAVLDSIEDIFINGSPAWRVAMPADSNITIGDTTDFYGYLAFGPSGSDSTTIGQTWFGAKGSVSTGDQDEAGTNGAAADNARQVNGFGAPSVTAYESARVNMLNGRYEYSSTDMTVGNQGAPYELSFTRSYNSALRLTFQDMGFGWCHNWQMKASENSDGFIALGDQQVLAAVPAIVALFVTRALAMQLDQNDDWPIENIVTACIVQDFLAARLVDNVVRLQFGGGFAVFTKMHDDSYLPPMGMHAASLLEWIVEDPEEDSHWKFTTAEKVVHTYNPDGLLTSIAYPFGVTIDVEYEGVNNRLVRVTNGFRELNFEYDLYNQLSTIDDGNGRQVQLTIDYNTGNLTAVSDPLPVSNTHYEYDQRGRMTVIKKSANPNDPIVTNVYDSLSRVKEQEDAYGNVWQFFLAGSRSEEVAPAVAPATEGTSRILYFNKRGSAIRTINALGQSVTTEYDGNERPILVTMPEGNSVSTVYNAAGSVLSVTQHAKPGSGLSDRTTSFAYGDTNWPSQPDEITDPAGKVTTKTFDATTSKVTQITLEEVAEGTPTTIVEYNSIGQVTRTAVKVVEDETPEDEVWLVTENSYDSTGENPTHNLMSTIVDPYDATENPNGLDIATSFTFDDVGNVLTTTDPNGNVSTAAYNANRWVTQVTGPTPFNQVAYITYDDNGNVIETRSLASTDPNTQATTKTYAIDGKVLTVTGPVNFGQASQPIPVRYEYDEMRRVKSVTDPLGNVATTVFDAISRPVSSAINGVTRQSITYTDNGKVASVTDAEDNMTEYDYDGFDRSVVVTYPDSTTEEVTFDVRDNVLTATTRAGLVYTFEYDVLSRLESKTPYGQPTVSFSYDLASRTISVSTPVVSGDPSTGTFQMFYDSAGRMVKERYEREAEVKVVEISSMDDNGNVLQLKYPDASTITNTFDELDRVTSISGFSASVSFAYDSASRRTSQSNGNGTGQGYWFDRVDNLHSMIIGGLKPNVSLGTPPRIELAYGISDIGQTVSKSCNDDAFLWQPNVEEMHTTQYGQANNLNQYPSVENDDFIYDDNGCLTDDGTNTYAYDHANRLVSVTTPGGTVSFKYDPFGRLTLKTIGSNKTRYLYSGMQRIEEYNGNTGALLKRYVWGAGLDECLFVVDAATEDVTYLHADETGSTVLTTDQTGTPINRNVYSPWGELTSGSLSDISVGFTGQFYEPEVEVYFYKARHYSPKLGRFLQPDPIGYKGGLNLYEYCGSDPVNASDPLGLGPEILLSGAIAITELFEAAAATDILVGTVIGGASIGAGPVLLGAAIVGGAIATGIVLHGAMSSSGLSPLQIVAIAQKTLIDNIVANQMAALLPKAAPQALPTPSYQNQSAPASSVSSDRILWAKSSTSGNNRYAQYGREQHNLSPDPNDPNWKKNFPIPETRLRIDWYHLLEGHIIEVKPDSLLQIVRGIRQVANYAQKMEAVGKKVGDIFVNTYQRLPRI
jgi:RHS repeat-associated protein